jgi:type II secretory pathway predicted ATPase ExeA
MYEDYFGLERPPFKITPDTSLFYDGGKRGDILAALVYAIHRGEGIIKVVGEVGSGKTMLCRMLQLKLPDSVEIVYIANQTSGHAFAAGLPAATAYGKQAGRVVYRGGARNAAGYTRGSPPVIES